MTQPPLQSLTRAGVIGDVHAEDIFLEAALTYLTGLNLDALLCVGDIVDGAGSAERCCELLARHGVLTVRGNHDRWFLAGQARQLPEATPSDALTQTSRAFLAGLPASRVFATPAGPLLLCHGLGDDDMARVTPDDFGYALEANISLQALRRSGLHRVVVNGHTHRRMNRKIDPLILVNAGALKRNEGQCFLTIDFTARKLKYHNIRATLEIAEGESFTF